MTGFEFSENIPKYPRNKVGNENSSTEDTVGTYVQ